MLRRHSPPRPAAALALALAVAWSWTGGSARGDVPEEEKSAARELLQAVARENATLETLQADYVQERESELSVEPLRSSGVLYYSRADSCLVFRSSEPREVVLRLDARSYQVYRPDKKQAERYVFRGSAPGAALLRVFGTDLARMEEAFELVAYRKEGGETRISLRPQAENIRRVMERLDVTIRDRVVTRIAYAEPGGETVRIELSRVQRNPRLAREVFSRDLPADVSLRTTEVE